MKEESKKVYHGTTEAAWEGISKNGLREGSSFASDIAFAMYWASLRFPEEKIAIVEAELPISIFLSLSSGIRSGKIQCSQYTVPSGMPISPSYLRICETAELVPHREYVAHLMKG